MSLLDNYYNRTRADDFEAVFDGTHLGRHPTENRHRCILSPTLQRLTSPSSPLSRLGTILAILQLGIANSPNRPL